MKILLININPVVSRLFTVCTRSEYIILDEVESAYDVDKAWYDIVFVDEDSYSDDVQALFEEVEASKKVFISYGNEVIEGFHESIKKPFLPSQIMNIIKHVGMIEPDEKKEELAVETNSSISALISKNEHIIEEERLPDIFPLSREGEETDDILEPEKNSETKILNSDEVEKIKALLEMDDDETVQNDDDVLLDDDEYEVRKMKVIKEQLMADGLEIVEENEIVEELSVVDVDAFEKTSRQFEKKEKKKKNKKKKKKRVLSEEEISHIEDAMVVVLGKMKPKKMKKLLKGKEIKVKIKLEDDQ